MPLPKPIIPPPGTEPNKFDGLVSIIIPTFNCAKTLPKSIASLKAQTYRNTEIIVSDDASTDNTNEVIASLGVIYVRQEKNSGAAVARNAGAQAAKGGIFLFAEADGYYDEDYVEKILRHMNLPGVVGAINLGRKVWTDKDNVLVRHQNDLFEAIVRLVLAGKRGTGAWAFERKAFFKVGGYDPGCRIGQDVDLVQRLVAAGGKTTVGARSILYHMDPDNLRAYMRRAHRGAFNSGLYRARWHGMSSVSKKLIYLVKFTALALLPVYLFLAFAWHWAFALPFLGGIAYLVAEDQATFLGWRIGLARGDIATFLATPGLLYLRRLAIGIGRIKSFFK
jgi:glycosyltransferase involved in cell wall biosynthesis